MKLNKIPFFLLIILICSCNSELNNNTSPSFDGSSTLRTELTMLETAKLAAFDIFTLNEFAVKNIELFEIHKDEISRSSENNLIPFLNNNGFQDSNSILMIMSEYKNHIDNLNYYICKEKTENGHNDISITIIYKMVVEELNSLYLQKYPAPSGNPCLQAWENDMQDCRDVAWLGSIGSIAAAGSGIIPGLIGAGLTMAEFTRCKRAAQRDYEICMN